MTSCARDRERIPDDADGNRNYEAGLCFNLTGVT
jgi:hypothetical protein